MKNIKKSLTGRIAKVIGVLNTHLQKNEKIYIYSAYLALVVVFILYTVLMGYYNRPVSDDYSFSQLNNNNNPFDLGLYGYLYGNGRFGQYFMFELYNLIFGLKHTVILAPIINTSLLTVSIFLLSLVIIKNYLKQKKYAHINAFLVAALASFVVIFSSKSIFDASLWLDSSVSYISSLTMLIFNAYIFTYLYIHKRVKLSNLALLFFGVLIGQQFSEPTSVIIICIALLMTTISIFFRSLILFKLSLIGLIAALSGFFLLYISPGSQARRIAYESTFNFYNMFIESISRYGTVLETTSSWRIWISVCLGVLVFYVIKKAKITNSNIIAWSLVFLAFIFIPHYILFVISEYASNGYIALRSFQVPGAFTQLGIAGIVALFLYKINIKHRFKSSFLVIISSLFVAVAFTASFRPLATIIKAEAIRSVQYDYREISIRKQVNIGNETIYVYPAPIILSDAEPGEFIYTDKQIDWFEFSFKKYYGIENKTLEVVASQISPYCIINQNLPWWGALSCENLDLPYKN